jgi:hypothetical protein
MYQNRAQSAPQRSVSFFRARKGSLVVDLNVVFAAAIGDRDHDPDADQYRDSDQSPRGADTFARFAI